jgi:hypothetical protein
MGLAFFLGRHHVYSPFFMPFPSAEGEGDLFGVRAKQVKKKLKGNFF